MTELLKAAIASGQVSAAQIEAHQAAGELPTPCLDASMDKDACANRAQCWESCGELGRSAEHARAAGELPIVMFEPPIAQPVRLVGPTVHIENCSFKGTNEDGGEVFKYRACDDGMMVLTEIRMVGWNCQGPTQPVQPAFDVKESLRYILRVVRSKCSLSDIDDCRIRDVIRAELLAAIKATS